MEKTSAAKSGRKGLKRPNGSGTVYQIKDGPVWAVQYFELNPSSGEQTRKTKKFRNRKDAFAFLESINHNSRNGLTPTLINKTLTVRDFLDAHISRYTSKKAPETLRNYQGAAARINAEIGALPAAHLTPRDIEDLIDALASKYGANTVANAYAVLRAAYNKAIKLGELASNPVLRVDAPKRNLNPTSHIPFDDFRAIYETASLHPYSHARIEVGMFVPIRPGEILGLRWEDIDWSTGTVFVERQLQWVKNEGLVFRQTKNKKSRTIPLSPGTLAVLKTHQTYQEMSKAQWESDEGLIFPNTVGKPLDAKRDHKWWKDLLQRAGVPDYQRYQMRKTAISLLENLGTPQSTILKFTGHSNISTVYSHYATSTNLADATAIAGLEEMRQSILSGGI